MPRDGFPRTPPPSPTAPRTACHGGRTPTATATSAFVGRGREPAGTTASTVTPGGHAEQNEARAVEGVAAAVDHHNRHQGRASQAEDGLTRPWAKPLGRAAGAHSRHSQRGAPARGRFRRGANSTPPAPLASSGSQTTRSHCRSSPPPRPPPQAPTGRIRRALPAPRNWRRGVALGREGGASMAPRRRPHLYPPSLPPPPTRGALPATAAETVATVTAADAAATAAAATLAARSRLLGRPSLPLSGAVVSLAGRTLSRAAAGGQMIPPSASTGSGVPAFAGRGSTAGRSTTATVVVA